MITPAYAPTATERVLPRLALDFTTASLDARVSVTRALNTATAVGSNGYITIVNANLPRFDYDPVTLACKGLLIEESRTNSMTYSGDIQSYWGAAFATLSGFSSTAPDGTATVCKVLPNTSTNPHGAQKTISTTGQVTFSIYAKSNGYNRLVIGGNNTNYVYFNLDTGVIESSLGTNWTAATVAAAGNGWYRCSATTSTSMGRFDAFAFNALQTNGNTAPSFTGNGTSSILLWGAQLEAGAFPTSYIPTTTTSLTRNRDSVFISGTNFSDWYNQDEGTFVFEATAASGLRGGAQGLFSLNNGTTANVMNGARTNTGVLRINSTGSPAGDVSSVAAIANLSTIKAAFGYEVNNWGLSLNAATPVIDTAAVVLPVTRLGIGSLDGLFDADAMWDGQIRKIQYYPFRLSNAELQAFSANP